MLSSEPDPSDPQPLVGSYHRLRRRPPSRLLLSGRAETSPENGFYFPFAWLLKPGSGQLDEPTGDELAGS